jgi:multidrug efflux pump
VWLGPQRLAGPLGLPDLSGGIGELVGPGWQSWSVTAACFAPGATAGLLAGWFLIQPVNAVLGWLFRGFNALFDQATILYGWTVSKLLRISLVVLLVYGGLLALTQMTLVSAPTGFIPEQDQGRLILNVQLPDSASLQRTQRAMALVDEIAHETPGVAHTVTISGLSFLLQANASNFGSMFIVLDPFDKRRAPGLHATDIMARLRREFRGRVKDAVVVVRNSSPIPGLGVAGGYKLIVEDQGGRGLKELQDQTDNLVRTLKGEPALGSKVEKQKILDAFGRAKGEAIWKALQAKGWIVSLNDDRDGAIQRLVNYGWDHFDGALAPFGDAATKQKIMDILDQRVVSVATQKRAAAVSPTASTQFRSQTPQLYLDIDRTKAEALGLSFDDVNQTLSMYLGSLYINSFNQFGRHWQVNIQLDGEYRNRVEDINLLQVRNKWGKRVPLGTLIHAKEIGGPISVTRYNLYEASAITGNLQAGVSSGETIAAIDNLAGRTLPLSMRAEWTELMYVQIRAGNKTLFVFALAVASVFLALAALYESWSLPMAVILVVPMCMLCSVTGVLYTGREVNIFVQIGLVVLVGLACKNAILIVEYAKQKQHEGLSRYEATVHACRQRLRPILMTSFAFIIGVIPLAVAAGAGAEMRRSLGIAVFSGMLGVTLFGIFLTPVFFSVIQGLGERRPVRAESTRLGGSALLGGLAGLTIGFLLARLDVVGLPWGLGVGGPAGVLAALAVAGVHQRIRFQARDSGQVAKSHWESDAPNGVDRP